MKNDAPVDPQLQAMPSLAQIASNYGALCSIEQAAMRVQPMSAKAREYLQSASALLRNAAREELAQLSAGTEDFQ